ncbi:MAG TPA: hypothetical protein ENI51_06250 [Candidatus Atribacteria bacterium]|nr:hypothetical protein [Candidatus Atribacteria bacterium]
MKEKYVMEEDWDFLIILDACRYDYFRDVYQKYFGDGKLEKAFSPAIETIEWVEKNFREYYSDVIYISTTPFINSKKCMYSRGFCFDAKKHFYKIVDLWDWGWDYNIGTVRPEKVNKAALKEHLLHPDKRMIIHYMQPHAPYLSMEKLYLDMKKNDGREERKKFEDNIWKWLLTDKTKKILTEKFMLIFGTEFIWKLNKIFHFKKVHPLHIEMAWRMIGRDGIIKAYVENLHRVLKCVQEIVENLHGRIIITSDHGELLGENGLYGHGLPLPRHTKLVEIPWFAIDKKKENISRDEKEIVKDKILNLKRTRKL